MNEKFYKAWWWLNENHFWALRNLDIDVVKVHPKLKRIVDDDSKNTLINYWLETGSFTKPDMGTWHDLDLDCGGDTFEEAIINLAKLVKKHYGKESDEYGQPAKDGDRV